MEAIHNIQGGLLVESTVVKQVKNKLIIQGIVMRRGQISRNNMLYDWESVKQHAHELIGKPLLYNHLNDGANKPIGHVIESYADDYTWYYKADVNPNSEYADSILRGDLNKVSIQLIAAKVTPVREENGKSYSKAIIGDLLELSVVPTPGFIDSSIEIAVAEAFKQQEQENKKTVEELEAELYIKKLGEEEVKVLLWQQGLGEIAAESFVEAEIDQQYQNPDGSFKKMKAPGADHESKFGGCVLYMMHKKGLSQESAEKLCAYIARNK